MPLFNYKAVDNKGEIKSGLIESENIDIAFDTLKEKGMNVITLKASKEGLISEPIILNRIKTKDIVIFSRQFSVLVSANVSLVQALKILVDQIANPKLKLVVSEIADEIDGGIRLSDALEKRVNVFSEFYVSVVRSGETSGKLDEVLNYLAEEMEKDYDMTSKIKGAMIYPAFVFTSLLGVGVLMMIFVIPKLTAVLTESGVQLPIATRVLVGTSRLMVSYWPYMAICTVGIIFFVRMVLKSKRGKRMFDLVKLRLPVFGKLFQKIYLVRFTRSMETLILGGVTISNSLRISSDVVGNEIYREIIDETIKEVEDGNSISTIFSNRTEIPKMVSEMMSIGEKTGKLDTILAQITNFYSREISNVTANLMTLMEPLIMVIMGVAVAIMVAAIILPMYNVASGT
jgi:type II secretory pathway component PulF